LLQQGFERVRIWVGGVDADEFHPRRASPAMRSRLSGGEPARPLLLFVGRLSAEKNLTVLPDFIRKHPEYRLAVIGDGPLRAELERQCAGLPVHFTGYLHGEELAAAYASSDVLVYPSRTETLGLSVLEAMATGCPVVVANAGGLPSLTGPGRGGLLYDPDDPEGLSQAVGSALREGLEGETLAALRRQARVEAERLSWATATEELVASYQQAIDSKRHLHRWSWQERLQARWAIASVWLESLALGLGVSLGLLPHHSFGHWERRPQTAPEPAIAFRG
jgi:glycosyltransferase involved in cell wall biosynthesis